MIPAQRSHLYVSTSTHPGMSGKNNEDRYAVSGYQIGIDQPIQVTFAIVSDGIGGHRAGEIAAGIAVEQINHLIQISDASTPIQTLKEAIKRASQSIFEQSESDLEKRGMGATCACAWIIGNRLFIAYVGDSRIYLIRGDTVLQLSKDHTWIQDALDAGILKTREAQNHPNAHVIRRFLGSAQPVEPDTRLYLSANEIDANAESNQGLSLLPEDQIILCSDGLTDLVNQEEMYAAFTSMSQELALRRLTDLANQRGGHDNITIVALKVPSNDATKNTARTSPTKVHHPRQSRRLWKTCLLILLLLVAIAISIVGGYFYLKGRFPVNISPTVSYKSPLPKSATPPSIVPVHSATPAYITSSTRPPLLLAPARSPILPTIRPTSSLWPTNTSNP